MNNAEPVISLDYEKMYNELFNEFQKYREMEEDRLIEAREKVIKNYEMQLDEYRQVIKKLEDDVRFKDGIIKSVLHIR